MAETLPKAPIVKDDAVEELGNQLAVGSPSEALPVVPATEARGDGDPAASEAALLGAAEPVGPMAEGAEEAGGALVVLDDLDAAAARMWAMLEPHCANLDDEGRRCLREGLRWIAADLRRRPRAGVGAAGPLVEPSSALELRSQGSLSLGDRPASPEATYEQQAARVSLALLATAKILQMGGDAPAALACLVGDTLVTPERPTWPAAVPGPLTVGADGLLRGEWLLRALLRPEADLSLLEDEEARRARAYLARAARDPRALALVLAKRSVELREAHRFPKDTRLGLALEGLQVLAPLAHGLDLAEEVPELEDLSLKILFPKTYGNLRDWVEASWTAADAVLEEAAARLRERLSEALPPGTGVEVRHRKKSLRSIFRKLMRRPAAAGPAGGPGAGAALYDVLGMRVVLDPPPGCADLDEAEAALCRAACGVVHCGCGWRPVPGRFKDYVSRPKPNGYSAIHTAVALAPSAYVAEVQVRGRRMHEAAERGGAAHGLYKAQIRPDDARKLPGSAAPRLPALCAAAGREGTGEACAGLLPPCRDELPAGEGEGHTDAPAPAADAADRPHGEGAGPDGAGVR